MATLTWNPFDPRYIADPLSFIKEIREKDPVNKGISGQWVVTRYEDIKRVTADNNFIAYDLPGKIKKHGLHRSGFEGLIQGMNNWILYQNPTLHTLNKKTIFKIWNQLEPGPIVTNSVNNLLEGIAGREVDFIESFALPMPVRVMNKLLGLEEFDHDTIREWSFNLTNTQEPFSGLKHFEDAEKTSVEARAFLSRQVDLQSENEKRDTFISAFLHAEDISREDVISMLILLLMAGVETTITIFGNIVAYLIAHPEVVQIIRENPDRIDDHVEELLRLNHSARYIARMASHDCQLGDKLIKRGDTLYLSLYSANHDPEVFDDPDSFKLRTSNPHLSFGHGAHHCLGAVLSRLEIKVFLKKMLEMGLSFESAGEKELDKRSVIFRRVLRLPVRVIRRH